MGQETEIFFIMGLDSLAELPTWHQPERLIESCRLVAVKRPGVETDLAELESSVPGIASQVDIIEMPEVDISSSELQQRVRDGLPIKYQVPEEVERYIMEHGLYGPSAGSAN
jgi:nicotinate-nucleotide adenylyltransferase